RSITDAAQEVGENSGLDPEPRAGRLSWLARVESGSDGESDRVHHALYRRLDHPVPGVHAGDHTAAETATDARSDQVSPPDRAVRVLLRLPPLLDLPGCGQVLRLPGNLGRRRQAAVHYDGLSGIRLHAAAGGDFDHGLDPS